MAIAIVGSAVSAKSVGSVSSIGVSITPTAGNRIIAVAFVAAAKVGTVSGSVSGALTADKVFNDVAGIGIFSQIATGGVETITFTPTSADLCGIVAAEFSGTHATYADTTNAAGDISTAAAPGAALPSVNGCLVIGGVACGSASAVTYSLPTNFTLLAAIESDSNTGQGEADYEIQTTATSRNPAWTVSSATWWAAAVMVYKPAAGGAALAIPVLTRQYRQRWS